MYNAGEAEKGVIKPDFNRSVRIDFKGAKITSDTGVLMLREVDERFDIIGPMEDDIEDSRSPRHTRHSIVQMIRQRVYQIAAGYEDCNDADHLRIDPALRLAIDKGQDCVSRQTLERSCHLGFSFGPSLSDGAWLWLAWSWFAWKDFVFDMGDCGLVCTDCVLGGSRPLFLPFSWPRKRLDYSDGGLIRSMKSDLRLGNVGRAACRTISDY
jgi:hypothetical protein